MGRWDALDRAIRKRDVQPTNLRELGEALVHSFIHLRTARLQQVEDFGKGCALIKRQVSQAMGAVCEMA